MASTPVSERAWASTRKEFTEQGASMALLQEYSAAPSVRVRNRIAILNDRLALEIANRWVDACPVPLEDLSQIARMGLLKAIEKFEPDSGNAFSSFAVPYIEGEILHYLRDDNPDLVKIPRRARETAARVRKAHRQLVAAGRVDLDECKVAINLGVHNWQWIDQATSRQTVLAIDEAVQVPAEQDDRWRSWELVKKELARLPNPYRSVLLDHFFAKASVETIARQNKTTVPEVQGWLQAGLDRLRARKSLVVEFG